MAKSLDALLSEADAIIETKLAQVKPELKDDIFKLAEELTSSGRVSNEEIALSLTEKIAHSIAVVDTLLNLETLSKMATFEDKAVASGYSEAQLSKFFEKKAGVKFRSVLDELPWLKA